MKIQIISANRRSTTLSSAATCSLITSPKSLDEFDINVIDLSSGELWRYAGDDPSSINQINDFKSISNMILRKSLSKVLIVLPQNVDFFYYYFSQRYNRKQPLKDILGQVRQKILTNLLPATMPWPDIQFENTRTTLDTFTYTADFYFDNGSNVVALSNLSKKITVIEIEPDSVYATSLNIFQSDEMLFIFLNHIFPNGEKENAPSSLKS